MLVGVELKGVSNHVPHSSQFFIPTPSQQPPGFLTLTMVSVQLSRISIISLHQFQVTVIIFIVPLSAFNQVLDEGVFYLVLEMTPFAHRHHVQIIP